MLGGSLAGGKWAVVHSSTHSSRVMSSRSLNLPVGVFLWGETLLARWPELQGSLDPDLAAGFEGFAVG